jgi:hypothetical protein
MSKKIRIRIRDEQPGSYGFRELKKQFFEYSFMRIRDRKNSDPGPGMEKFGSRINIPDHNTVHKVPYLVGGIPGWGDSLFSSYGC